MIERINLLLKAKNITARQFADEIGIQPSGMSHILSGRNNPSLDFVMKVVKRWPEVNINWLMLGNGEMYGTVPLSVQPSSPNVNTKDDLSDNQPDLFSQPESVLSDTVVSPQSTANENPIFSVPKDDDTLQAILKEEPAESHNAENPVPNIDPIVNKPSVPSSIDSIPITAVECKQDTTPSNISIAPVSKNSPKKIQKIVVLYDDHSFAEYYPE